MNQHIYHIKSSRNAIKVILCRNAHPNNHGKGGGHYALYSAMFSHYTALQMKNSTRNVSAINPVAMEMACNKHNSQHSHKEATSCYCELTPCIVNEKNWNTKEDKEG